MTVDEYRKKHKRCKTCAFAYQKHLHSWVCTAKGTEIDGRVGDYYFRGCFCRLYKAREVTSL